MLGVFIAGILALPEIKKFLAAHGDWNQSQEADIDRRDKQGDECRNDTNEHQGTNAEILTDDDLACAKLRVREKPHQNEDIVHVRRGK